MSTHGALTESSLRAHVGKGREGKRKGNRSPFIGNYRRQNPGPADADPTFQPLGNGWLR